MNPTITQADWTQLKGKISAKWSQLTDSDVEKFRNNMEAITEKIQKVYGHSKEKAEQEYKDFTKSLSSGDASRKS